jgi:hypothetical protein
MGFVSLDILYAYPEDSGEYVCRAVNDLGEDTTRATISCKSKWLAAVLLVFDGNTLQAVSANVNGFVLQFDTG